jgi:hypothetical protein
MRAFDITVAMLVFNVSVAVVGWAMGAGSLAQNPNSPVSYNPSTGKWSSLSPSMIPFGSVLGDFASRVMGASTWIGLFTGIVSILFLVSMVGVFGTRITTPQWVGIALFVWIFFGYLSNAVSIFCQVPGINSWAPWFVPAFTVFCGFFGVVGIVQMASQLAFKVQE